MTVIDSAVLQAPLSVLQGAKTLHYCSAEPANFAGVAAVSQASKDLTISAPAVRTETGGGFEVTIPAVTDAATSFGSGTQTLTHWAITSGTTLHIASSLSSSETVLFDKPVASNEFKIYVPNPA